MVELPHVLRLVLAAAVLVACTACGVESPGGVRAEATDPPGSPTPARGLLLQASDLPAGFSDSGGQSPGYAQEVCGVPIEPVAPLQTASARFSRGPLGPFVEQRVRVYPQTDAASAAAMVARLRTALATCDHYELPASADAPAARFAVEPLSVPDLGPDVTKDAAPDVVAWRQTPEGRLPVPTDVVLMRRGATVVVVTSYALKQAPDAGTTARAARAAARRLSA